MILSNPMKQVRHGNPGIGATKSSAYTPLKQIWPFNQS